MQVRRSFVEELDLSASEVEIVLDYFVYGREVFQPEEVAFVEGMYNVHDKQTNLPHISLVQETQEKLDPQSFLTLPS